MAQALPNTYDNTYDDDFGHHPSLYHCKVEAARLEQELTPEKQQCCKTILRDFFMCWWKPAAKDADRMWNAIHISGELVLDKFELPDSTSEVGEYLNQLLSGVKVNELPWVCELLKVDLSRDLVVHGPPPGFGGGPLYLMDTQEGREDAWRMASSSGKNSKELQELIRNSAHLGGDGEKLARQFRGRAVDAIKNRFAVLVVNVIIECLGDEYAEAIAEEIICAKGDDAAWELASGSNDTSRTLQRLMIESPHYAEKFAKQMRGRAVDAIKHGSANFALNVIIVHLGGEHAASIAQEIVRSDGGAIAIACTSRGCRIIRELLRVSQTGELAEEMLGVDGAYRLMTDELHFGHHAVDIFEDPRSFPVEHRCVVESVSSHMDACMHSKDGRYYVLTQLKNRLENGRLSAEYLDANPNDYASLLTNALLHLTSPTYTEMAKHKEGSDILNLITENHALNARRVQHLQHLENEAGARP